ncbi:hypothetical protein SDC9_89922 [bioreactor metagenome]|uniref:Uncharacterized protein n=1 Tax=bioreactor metagenome TaxID=1076179 RepID=A0A644ZQJ0_9ZZZZ
MVAVRAFVVDVFHAVRINQRVDIIEDRLIIGAADRCNVHVPARRKCCAVFHGCVHIGEQHHDSEADPDAGGSANCQRAANEVRVQHIAGENIDIQSRHKRGSRLHNRGRAILVRRLKRGRTRRRIRDGALVGVFVQTVHIAGCLIRFNSLSKIDRRIRGRVHGTCGCRIPLRIHLEPLVRMPIYFLTVGVLIDLVDGTVLAGVGGDGIARGHAGGGAGRRQFLIRRGIPALSGHIPRIIQRFVQPENVAFRVFIFVDSQRDVPIACELHHGVLTNITVSARILTVITVAVVGDIARALAVVLACQQVGQREIVLILIA